MAMAVALDPDCPKDLLRHLIVADIAPVPGRLTSEFPRYMEAMLKIQNEGKVKSRKEAFDALYEYENVCAQLLAVLQYSDAYFS